MQSLKAGIPDRFLAFAFGAGDILVEVDGNYVITSIDGAQTLIDPDGDAELIGSPFIDLLAPKGRKVLERVMAMKDQASFRLGPFPLAIGVQEDKRRRFCLFVNKLLEADRIFLSLSLEQRLLAAAVEKTKPVEVNKVQKEFVDRVQNLFEKYPNDRADFEMTVVDALTDEVTPQLAQEITEGFAEHSVGGDLASQIGDGRFAYIHAKDPSAPDPSEIVKRISSQCGVPLNGETLEQGVHGDVDAGVFLHTMREIVEGPQEHSLADIAKNYDDYLKTNVAKAGMFQKAIDKKLFDLSYQPIVSMTDGEVHHYEALARFKKEVDFESPFEAIKFAEDVGLIRAFDQSVLEKVIKELILARGRQAPLKIAVNVSGNSLSQPAFCTDLLKLLKKHQTLHEELSLEITESFQIADLEALGDIVNEIQMLGFMVYLDDFGAGASGFQYLRKLHVDGVKIDGPYIQDAENDPVARAFLKAMVGLCHELGMTTVAEWIETEEQQTMLRELNVDYGQGFLYGQAGKLPKGGDGPVFRAAR